MYMHELEILMKDVFSNHSECVVGKSLILSGFNLTFQKNLWIFLKKIIAKLILNVTHHGWSWLGTKEHFPL